MTAHYQKIVTALRETIGIMARVDQAIEHYGGWPDAFEVAAKPAGKRPEVAPI